VILKHLESPTPAAETRLRLLNEARQSAQKLLQHVQNRKDNKKLMEIKEGDQVWLEGRNLTIAGNHKLSPKRYGPFKVSQKISPMAMRLALPLSMKIHNVFHTDLLLPYKETVETYYCLWQAVGDDLVFEVEVIDPKDNQEDVEQEER